MFQDILALLTVAIAVFYALWSFFRIIYPSKKQHVSYCQGCITGGCNLNKIKTPSIN
jgi:hypothetical protein